MCQTIEGMATDLYRGVMLAGGATITLEQCPEHGNWTLPVRSGGGGNGYAVARQDMMHMTNDIERWSVANAFHIVQLVTTERGIIQWMTQPFGAVGMWHDRDTGELVFEACEIYQDETVALAVASGRDQKAIYDLGLGVEIFL